MLNALDVTAVVVLLGVLYHRMYQRRVAETRVRRSLMDYARDEFKMPYR